MTYIDNDIDVFFAISDSLSTIYVEDKADCGYPVKCYDIEHRSYRNLVIIQLSYVSLYLITYRQRLKIFAFLSLAE